METSNKPNAKWAIALKGLRYFLLKKYLNISMIYLDMINVPAKIENNIIISVVLNIKDKEITKIIEKIKDKTIGFLSILMVIFLDHLESTEKNKNNDANITIGINIAL